MNIINFAISAGVAFGYTGNVDKVKLNGTLQLMPVFLLRDFSHYPIYT